MPRTLIVNADDANLTPGVTAAILDCHDHGMVTSTTVLINLAMPLPVLRAFKRRTRLGVGLHLNITLGRPVSPPHRVASLLDRAGRFKKWNPHNRVPAGVRADDIRREYDAQIRKFRRVFGRLPTHLDTHHQLHDAAAVRRIVGALADQYGLAMRRTLKTKAHLPADRSPGHLFGQLDPKKHWRRRTLLACLDRLPSGVSEIMCHPGAADTDLKKISSFVRGRETEWKIFRDKKWKGILKEKGIALSHFGLCYNRKK